MIAVVVFAMCAVLVAAFAIAGWREIGGPGACEHLDDIRDERWEW